MALTDGLELVINFNSDVLDKSGNGRNGTVTGMTYNTTTPMIDGGNGVFDGNDYVEIDVSGAKSGILDLTVGTLAFWVRLTSPLNEYKRLFNISQGLAFPNSDDWGIDFRGDLSNQLNIICVNGGSVIMNAISPVNTITDSNKHLIIIKANGSGNIELKVDDVVQTLTGTIGEKFFGDAVDADNMFIGAIKRDTISAIGSKEMDALAAWNKGTTNAEDTAYYNNGNGIELEVDGGVVIKRRRMEGY